ncbi:MAG: superoxide dismutase [Clostridium sp.]|nr:superoxide dismutase [Bacteroides sp.]MCM1198962.1 superoxide dismutase [Clostridium sp.]
MKHSLPTLPYAQDALAPAMSAETLEYHYGKHLQTYIDNLNRMIAGTEFENMPLEDIVKKSDGSIFNNAAQTWNHTFFFETLSPKQPAMPEVLEKKLAEGFGSVDAFKEEFTKTATGIFGSGWAWLAKAPDGKLKVLAESGAGNPMVNGMVPLLTLDVWEHAYYIDYRNRRADFIKEWWKLVDWRKVADRL